MKTATALLVALLLIIIPVMVMAAPSYNDGSLVRTAVSGVTAAEYKADPPGTEYKAALYTVISKLNVELTFAPQNFSYAQGGKLYSVSDIVAGRSANPTAPLSVILAGLTPVGDPSSCSLEVIGID